LDSLGTLRACRSNDALGALWARDALDALRTLDRTKILPDSSGVICVENFLVFNVVGVSQGGGLGEVSGCGDSSLVVKAGSGSTLGTSGSWRASGTSVALRADGAVSTLRSDHAEVVVQSDGVVAETGSRVGKDGVSIEIGTLVGTITDKQKLVGEVEGNLSRLQGVWDFT
jgi:hypothetical protein